jgi:ABC-type Fe2+-enterobactin transport system substrate-binding protein
MKVEQLKEANEIYAKIRLALLEQQRLDSLASSGQDVIIITLTTKNHQANITLDKEELSKIAKYITTLVCEYADKKVKELEKELGAI